MHELAVRSGREDGLVAVVVSHHEQRAVPAPAHLDDLADTLGRSDGAPVGRVADVKTGRFILARNDGAGTETLDLNHVERVEGDRLVLTQTAIIGSGPISNPVREAFYAVD